MPSSLASHVAAANAKQGREWREDEAAVDVRRLWNLAQWTNGSVYRLPQFSAHSLLGDHAGADLLAALRTVSGEEEFGADPGRTWIEGVTEAVEDLIAEE